MSWLKNRIHPLQPRVLVAACALCLAVAGAAVIYWLPASSTEPAETSQVAKLQPEPSAAPAAGESLKPPEEDCPGRGRQPSACSGVRAGARRKSRPADPPRWRPRPRLPPLNRRRWQQRRVLPSRFRARERFWRRKPPRLPMQIPTSRLFPPPRLIPLRAPPPPGSIAGVVGGIMRGVGGRPPTSASATGRVRVLKSLTALDPSRMRIAAEETGAFKERGAQAGDRFARVDPNRVKVVAEEPVSTFSIDVDTASYSFLRASLQRGGAAAQGGRSHRGVDQLLCLRLSAAL